MNEVLDFIEKRIDSSLEKLATSTGDDAKVHGLDRN